MWPRREGRGVGSDIKYDTQLTPCLFLWRIMTSGFGRSDVDDGRTGLVGRSTFCSGDVSASGLGVVEDRDFRDFDSLEGVF